MDADIITSAPHPRDLPPAGGEAASDARIAIEAIARMVRARGRVLRVLRGGGAGGGGRGARGAGGTAGAGGVAEAEAGSAPAVGAAGAGRGAGRADEGAWWPALEAAVRAVVRSLAGASAGPLLGGLVERGAAGGVVSGRRTVPMPVPAEASATAHVLRVRARLQPAEQRRFDELARERALEALVAAVLHRGEDEAVAFLARELDVDGRATAAGVARQVGRLRAHLSIEEYDRMIMRVPHLTDEELRALHGHLRAMDPGSAALLVRSYLAVVSRA